MRSSWIILACSLVACAGTGGGGFNNDDASTGDDAASKADSPFGTDANVGFDGGGSDGSTGGKTLLYAHSNTTLYQLDPQDLKAPLQTIGDFDCIGGNGQATSMTDLAVDKNGNLYGVSQLAAYPLQVQGSTVHCAATWKLPTGGSVFYGLTFAPENTVAAAETLVAADSGGNIYSIDSQGQTAGLGNFGKDSKNNTYELSGDIVFLANGGTPVGFATVRTCPNGTCATSDTLVEIDVSKLKAGNTSSVVKSVRGVLHKGTACSNPQQPPSFGKMFGIAAYKDQVYGFSHDTGIVAINNVDASVCLVAVPNGVSFSGAGVTTVAPVIPPPN